jgi:hypothetical protein
MTTELRRQSRNPDITPYVMVVDGTAVPYIEIFEHPNGKFSITVVRPGGNSPLVGLGRISAEALHRWAPILANAMAVAAGRSSHGENSNVFNPHGSSLVRVNEPGSEIHGSEA